MNKSLTALVIKLNWQLNELNLHLQQTESQVQSLHEQAQKIGVLIDEAKPNSLIINPDLEINRLNFITQQHEKKDGLTNTLKNFQEVEKKLKAKIQRVKTELKMLEKYMEREQTQQSDQQKKIQSNTMDEWVIQKREPL